MMLSKKNLIIENDNPTQLEIIVTNHDSEGVFRYQPEPEDEVKLIIYTQDGEQVGEYLADISDPTYVFVNVDTTGIPAGHYNYRIVVTIAAEEQTYIINENDTLIIRR